MTETRSTGRPFEEHLALLVCPACKGPLAAPGDEAIRCASSACGTEYRILADRPVLIDERRSVFTPGEYRAESVLANKPAAQKWYSSLSWPSINHSAVRCFERMRDELLARTPSPVVLLVGGGIMGKGMRALTSVPAIRIINVDPSPTSTAVLFCDGHDLPFADASMDAIVVQAVLEHVADPVRCVAEIHRVLKPGGLVYSETPFMQQVHLKGFDFTRFTPIGHRRLFRYFDELDSGVVAGPGTALAWAWKYFLAALAPRPLAGVARQVGRVMGFPFEQCDRFLRQRPGAFDGASCTYFLGTRADEPISDRDVLAGYRGCRP